MEYEIKLNKEHIYILIAALDLYSRIGIGQLEEAVHVTAEYLTDKSGWTTVDSPEYKKLKQDLLGFPSNASHSITSNKVHQTFKEAWTIKKLLDKSIVNPEDKYSVRNDGNILQLNELPEIEITKLKEEKINGK